jgi:hypothetical protein
LKLNTEKKWWIILQKKPARMEFQLEFRHIISKIWFSYIKAFGLSSLEKSEELKLLSFTQILFMAVKRLDFCQLILEIYV